MQPSENFNTSWRKTASTIYTKPIDSKIFGSVEIDITELERYIQAQRKAGVKVTLTHFFLLATARAIKEEVPELNTYLKRGNIYSHPHISATVSILMHNGEMGSVKMDNIDAYTLPELVGRLRREIQTAQKGDDKSKAMKETLARIPWPLRGAVYQFIKYLTVHLDFRFRFWDCRPTISGHFFYPTSAVWGWTLGILRCFHRPMFLSYSLWAVFLKNLGWSTARLFRALS